MALDPMDPSKLYIATHDGLYLLENEANLYRIGASRDDLMGFTMHPSESGVFFASGHSARGGNVGFQKSVDGGQTWRSVSQGLEGPVDFHAVALSSVNTDLVYGFFGGRLQRSTDGGRNWEYAKSTITPFSLSSDPTREHVLYAATQNGVTISEDDGDTWKSVSPQLDGGAVSVFAVHPTDIQFALAFSERLGGLGKSIDGGVTWQRILENFGGDVVLYLSFSKAEPNLAYALTSSNAIFKSMDKGDTWSKIR